MAVELTIKNYRCFSDEKPVRISLRKGFTALVGVNNSGKSSLLKFFYEFRNLFQILSGPDSNFIEALRLNHRAFNLMPTISDLNEVFHNGNVRDLEIGLRFEPSPDRTPSAPLPERLVLTIPRGTNTWIARLLLPEREVELDSQPVQFNDSLLRVGDAPLLRDSSISTALRSILQMMIGRYRYSSTEEASNCRSSALV